MLACILNPEPCALHHLPCAMYRGTSLNRNCFPLGPYRRPMPRVLGRFFVGALFLMSEVPLYPVPYGRVLGRFFIGVVPLYCTLTRPCAGAAGRVDAGARFILKPEA